ncbi:MAG: hypothetical protein PVJ60_07570, partial [Phycisphaerales bacterium]
WIQVNDSIEWDSENSLTLTANGDLFVYDVISNDGNGDLTLFAGGDIDIDYAVTLAGGHLEMLGGQNNTGLYPYSENADININANIEAASMRIKNGNDTSGEVSNSAIYVADGVLIKSTEGDIVMETVHDMILGNGVDGTVIDSAGDLFLNADEDGYGTPDSGYNTNPLNGGDLHARGKIDAEGDIEMRGNDILLEESVNAGGNMTIVGSTSEDNITGWGDVHAMSTLDAGGTIEVSGDDDTLYFDDNVTAGVDIILHNNTVAEGGVEFRAGDNVIIEPLKNVKAKGDLTIEAKNGEIDAESSDILMLADDKTLTLKQYETLDIEAGFRSINNRNNTDLVATSTGGTVTSDEAHEWKTITATAEDSIILSDTGGDITTKALTAMTGNIEVTADNYGQHLVKDDITAVEGDVSLYADDGIVVDDGKTISAGQDVKIGFDEGAHAYDSDVTLTGEGELTVIAGDNMTFGGDVEAHGDIELIADNDGDDVGDVYAMGSVTTTNSDLYIEGEDIQIDGAINIAGDIEMYAEENITLGSDAVAAGTMELFADYVIGTDDWEGDGTGDLNTKSLAASGIDGAAQNVNVDGTVYSNGEIYSGVALFLEAADNVTLGGTVEAVGGDIWLMADSIDDDTGLMWAKSSITTTNGDLEVTGEDIQVDGVVDIDGYIMMDADDDLTIASNVYADGSIDLYSSDNTTHLGGDLIEATGNITLHGNTVMDGANQRIEATSGAVITDDGVNVDKSTAGNLDIRGNTGIVLGGDVTGTGIGASDTINFENNVIANGSAGQRLDAYAGTLDADGHVNKTTAGSLNLGGESGILLGGDATTSNGDLVFENDVTADGTWYGWPLNQRFDADGEGKKLIAQGTITKTTAGDLMLGGGSDADYEIELDGNVEVQDGSLTVGDYWFNDDTTIAAGGMLKASKDVTVNGDLNGEGDLTVDAGRDVKVFGDLESTGDMLASAGDDVEVHGNVDGESNITVTANDDVRLYGNVTAGGNLEINSSNTTTYLYGDHIEATGNILLNNSVELRGSGNQRIDAETGTMTANRDLDKTTGGDLNIGGGSGIVLNDDVYTDNGNLVFEDAVTASAPASRADQEFSAGGHNKQLHAMSSITKTTAGDLHLRGGYGTGFYEINLDGDVTVSGGGNLFVGEGIDDTTVADGKTLTSTGGDVEVSEELYGEGNLNIWAADDVRLHGDATVENHFDAKAGQEPGRESVLSTKNVTAGSMRLESGNRSVDGSNWDTVEVAYGKNLTTTEGDLTVIADDDIYLGGNADSAHDLNIIANRDKYAGGIVGNVKVEGNLEADDDVFVSGRNIDVDGRVTADDDVRMYARDFAHNGVDGDVEVDGKVEAGDDITIKATDDIRLGGSWV